MLRARALRDINEQKACCEVCGMTHNPDMLYFAIFENETDCLGTMEFRFTKEGAKLTDVKPKIGTYDDEAMFILGKATLNFIDLVGPKYVEYAADDEKLCGLLEFFPKNGVMQVNLEGYFDEPCKRHHDKEPGGTK